MTVSVVIPCYNDGYFLKEAVNSVLTATHKDIELIIVNDGSNDKNTLDILEEYKKNGVKILSHKNQGLAFSRNRGITEAKGEYILPLDADNLLKTDYITKAVNLLKTGDCDIVYAKPHFFGENIPERIFTPHEFDGCELLINNYIDACAVFKKTVWQQIGGYDAAMPYQGMEDWEFWIHSFFKGFKFKFIDEELFNYRISKNSMITAVVGDKLAANHNYIILKHKNQIINLVEKGNVFKKFYENDQRNYLRTSIKYFIKFFSNCFR